MQDFSLPRPDMSGVMLLVGKLLRTKKRPEIEEGTKLEVWSAVVYRNGTNINVAL